MRKSLFFIALFSLALFNGFIPSAQAGTVTSQINFDCPPGSNRSSGMNVYEDTDGDGRTDQRTVFACDGTVSRGPYETTPVIVFQLDVPDAPVYEVLTWGQINDSTLWWRVDFRYVSSGAIHCAVQCTSRQAPTTTCQTVSGGGSVVASEADWTSLQLNSIHEAEALGRPIRLSEGITVSWAKDHEVIAQPEVTEEILAYDFSGNVVGVVGHKTEGLDPQFKLSSLRAGTYFLRIPGEKRMVKVLVD